MMFDFTKKKGNPLVEENIFKEYKKLVELSNDELLDKYDSSIDGLSLKEVIKRREVYGKNILKEEKKKSILSFIIDSFKDPFIYILIVLAVINFSLGDRLGSLIIILLAIISSTIRLVQDYSAYKFDLKLKSKLFTVISTIRDNKVKDINIKDIVPGDIIELNAGSIIPSDVILLEVKDLFINQSIFTGESVPIEKKINSGGDSLLDLERICFMNSSVVSGSGKALVIKTGKNTYLGTIAKDMLTTKKITNFQKEMNAVSKTLIEAMLVITVLVFILNTLIHHDIMQALLFAISVAVGITPSMLPMIVNVNLSKGSKSLAKKETLVKRSEAIENLGSIDTLCTDKTGTLTEDKIVLQLYLNSDFKEDREILTYAYLNSHYSTGIKNLIDKAIISYAKNKGLLISRYQKIDEIPFDYERRKASVIVRDEDKVLMLTKGAIKEVLDSCNKIRHQGKTIKLTNEFKDKILEKAKELNKEGMQVIALALKETKTISKSYNDDKDLTFIGLVAFLDPVKKGVSRVIKDLRKVGVNTKILTGDNPDATKTICTLAGFNSDNILTGPDIEKLTSDELKVKVEEVDVFARLTPLQKELIVNTLKDNGHVVGYMGDGVNDAPSLIKADVGISVNDATSIAKEASDIILLRKSLKVVYDGVIEGRKVYGNIMKYMKMALSASFGDCFSVLIASIFLPFLPMIPIQFLLQDLLYDLSQTAIPFDDVDKEFLITPHKWDTSDLKRFMVIMGLVASVIDVVAFLIFYFVLGFNSDNVILFQTAWFIEGVISQTMIVHFVRTSKIPFIESIANKYLLLSTSLCIIASIILPIILVNIKSFHFAYLPVAFYFYVIILLILYMVIEEIVKRLYIRKYKRWL
ncbi:MAG TPA: magnesium-translocating P-type ATPase [Candidatus Onthousia excrementipullorum]|uniref:Magnesium-transporting ATPase, P-type 1 n=1 Tax=Candidatus Onthousia excrementipullorum TaxID=2840884 RepID=A0A9D1DTE3_9FIRM|nr:magnesium-translocating P-type ATPase [Candidatus Onthousia excrementipullorum]